MTYANSRSLATLLCAAGAGVLIWAATQFNTSTQGGYWSVVGLFIAAGLTVALSQMLVANKVRTRSGFDPGAFLISFLPVLVVAGWIILAGIPSGSVASHFQSWSGSIGIKTFVNDMVTYFGVLAFGLAVVFDLCLRAATTYVYADEPAAVSAPAAAPITGAAAYEPEPVNSAQNERLAPAGSQKS